MELPGFTPTRRVERTAEGCWRVYVKAPSFMNTPEAHVVLSEDQYQRYCKWRSPGGGYIQNLLPDLSPSQREILMTGLDDGAFHAATKEEGDGG